MTRKRAWEIGAGAALLLVGSAVVLGLYAWREQRQQATRSLSQTLDRLSERNDPALLAEARRLLRVGADVHTRARVTLANEPTGFTALIVGAMYDDLPLVEEALARGADVNAKSNMGLTPIMQATMWGHDRIVAYLLSKGGRPNEADNEGLTALHNAVSDGHVKVVKVLMAAGADVNAKSAKGMTPLVIAQKKNNPELLAALAATANP